MCLALPRLHASHLGERYNFVLEDMSQNLYLCPHGVFYAPKFSLFVRIYYAFSRITRIASMHEDACDVSHAHAYGHGGRVWLRHFPIYLSILSTSWNWGVPWKAHLCFKLRLSLPCITTHSLSVHTRSAHLPLYMRMCLNFPDDNACHQYTLVNALSLMTNNFAHRCGMLL
jgi:hypothetical protein